MVSITWQFGQSVMAIKTDNLRHTSREGKLFK